MDALTRLMIRARQWQEANARRKRTLRDPEVRRSRFLLEFLEPRLLLSATPIAVTQFAADASGFTAQFNQAVDSTVLNLYDTEAGTAGPADVTVTGANQGALAGSLVANGNQLTFVKAGGILAPDVYTVTMRSASNGIKGADGSLLDGNSDGTSGDDYVNVFTVAQSPPAVISVADIARGPAQFINPGTGFPITLSEGTAVTDVRFSLNFDPALLKITEVHLGSSLPAETLLQSDLTQAGVVSVHISSTSPMNAGAVELVRLIAQIPDNAVYARAGVLDLSQVSVNDGEIPAVDDDGVQVVAYLGDTTGNQRYSALDGSRALRVVAGLDSGFAPYLTIDPIIIADITGNNLLSSLDGTRILQEVVGFDRPEIPDIVPVILVGLVEDTGVSDTDGITSDPSVSGTVSDDGTITSFRVGLDDMLPADFVDVTADLQGTSFLLTREILEQILGAPLADGVHTVHLQATDNAGIGPFSGGPTSPGPVFDPGAPSPIFNPGGPSPVFDPGAPSPIFNPGGPIPVFDPGASGPPFDQSLSSNTSNVDLTFTLDTTQPAIAALGLSAGSGTGTAGDNFAAAAQVLLTDASGAGATLTLNGAAVPAGAGGESQIPNVDLTDGGNAFTLTASDISGDESQQGLTATQQGTVTTDVALQLDQQALEAIRLTAMDPPLAAGVLAMVSLAQYDTPAAIDVTPAYLIHQSVAGPVSVDAALAEAAYTVLYALFPSQRSVFDTALNGLLVAIGDGSAKASAVALEVSVGSDFLVNRGNDGSDATVDYPGSTDVGMWLPDAPPALDSATYAQSVNEIESLGSENGSILTAGQAEIARHADRTAEESLSSNVRLFADLNAGMAESGIAVWNLKHTGDFWWPIDAIHYASQDAYTATAADPKWTPLRIPASLPELISGHSKFSAAAAAILAVVAAAVERLSLRQVQSSTWRLKH